MPAGIVFEDWGGENESAASAMKNRWDLRAITRAPFELKPGQQCATVAADIMRDSKVRVVEPKHRRHLEPAGMRDLRGRDFAPYPPIWDRVAQMTATVISSIR